MKNILPFLLIFTLISNAQVTNEGQPLSWSYSINELEYVEAKTLPDFDLKSIQEEDKINDLIKEHTNIKNIGSIQNKLLYKHFRNHDVFILPSKSEPWGLVVEEALYNGLPVIVSSMVGCADEIVKNDVNGFIFDINDKSSLKEKIDLITNLKTFNRLLNNVQSTDFDAVFNHQINAYI